MALYRNSTIITFKDGSQFLVDTGVVFKPVIYKTHLIKDNETLFDIALHYYKTTIDWYKLAEVNELIDPIVLVTGDTLIIPEYG